MIPSMPREPGEVDGKPAEIRTTGDGIDAIYDFRTPVDHDHLVSHDGINAAYLREHGRVIVDDFGPNAEALESIIRDAEQLYRVEKFREGHERVQRLRTEFKKTGSAGPRQRELRDRFERAIQRFYDEQGKRRAQRDKEIEGATKRKESLVFKARQISDSTNWKETSAEYRRLLDEWKKAGWTGKRDDKLWAEFSGARQRFLDRQKQHFDRRAKEAEDARYRKERLVADAREVSRSSNFGEAFTRLRELQQRWKQAGHAGEHEDRLWKAFRAAGDELRSRADSQSRQAELRKRELISEASSIATGADLRYAGQQWKSVMERWKAAGRASREVEDDLWSRLQGWKRQLDGRYEERRRQSADRTREHLSRLENALSKARDAVSRIESHIYDLRSRPPIRPGPRAWEFQSQRDAKISGLEMKRNDIYRSIQELEGKISAVRQQL
jgi:hypothetical protein